MSLSIPTLLNGLITLTANPPTLSPFQTTLPIKMPVGFTGVANLQVLTGTFSPANNTQTVVTGLAAVSPNFLMFMCDGIANLSSDNGMLTLLPVNKVLFQTLSTIAPGTNPIDALVLSGLTANPYPMIQGRALNYTMIYGQAQIS